MQLQDPQLVDLRRYVIEGTVSLDEFEGKDNVLHKLKYLPDRLSYQLAFSSSFMNSA